MKPIRYLHRQDKENSAFMDAISENNARKPFFSIIIPAYNAEKEYFVQCMESLKQQTFKELEIIVVDDGSRPECALFYDQAASEDPRIRVIHQTNQGVSAARNNGIQNAEAEWILFVDSDDWVEPDMCGKLHDRLCATDCEILLFNIIREYSTGLQREQGTGLASNTLYCTENVSVKEYFYRRAMGTPNIGNANLSTIYYSVDKAYSRDFLTRNALTFPVGLPKSEDKVFVLRCFEKMHSLFYFDEAFYHYRMNELSVSNRYSQNADEERRQLSVYLEEIAVRMDKELAALTGDPTYDLVYKDCTRFIFGIISDVLFSKFYHKDFPRTPSQRRREAEAFLKSEPFRSVIASCRYSELGTEAKIKKFMLTHGMTGLFCRAKRAKRQIKGQIRQ